MASQRKSPMDHPAVVTFLILAVIAAMSLAAEVLKPLALAVLLSFALAPLAGFFERRRVPRVIAVLLTVALALGSLGGIGFVVVRQLSMLAYQLPSYQGRIQKKVDFLKPSDDTVLSRAQKVVGDVVKSLDTPVVPGPEVMDVRVVAQPSFRERLQAAVGPSLEFVGVGCFVLILVLFMLMNREDVGDRIVQLFGQRQINLTTRTMGEIGQRISRYLAMITLVNAGYGLIVGLGLGTIGVPYAVLWGCLAAMMRFIPYVGAAVAFLLPLVFAVAHFPGWMQPLEVVALFGAVEVALSYLEPVIYGKTTGVSSLGLLVAAMFWTWLWGLLGTLLSTPMTLCLAVLGKYVPSLGFFATVLGEEAELDQNIRLYQRLVSLDQDGATAVVEAALKERPRAEVFDQMLVPALSRAGRDAALGELDESDMSFILRVIGEILDDLEGTADLSLKTAARSGDGDPGRANGTLASPPFEVAGVAASGTADALTLRMLGQILAPSKCTLVNLEGAGAPMQLAERVAEVSPAMVILSHLPPEPLAQARYQVRRLRGRFAALPIVVGRWGEAGSDAASEGLSGVGPTHVAFSMADARDQILARAAPAVPATVVPATATAMTVPITATTMAAATSG
ncbi:MAG: AI-2E family transporter [Isosphaeraceae bacterium]